MNWKCWAVIASLLLAIAIGLLISVKRHQEFQRRDAELVHQIEDHLAERDRLRGVVAVHLDRVQELETDKLGLEGDLQAARAKWRARKEPKDLTECKSQLVDANEYTVLVERNLDLETLTSQALADALFDTQGQVDQLEKAWQLERKRTSAFQKQQKREHVKKVLIGVGSGIAGAGVGFTIGVLTK